MVCNILRMRNNAVNQYPLFAEFRKFDIIPLYGKLVLRLSVLSVLCSILKCHGYISILYTMLQISKYECGKSVLTYCAFSTLQSFENLKQYGLCQAEMLGPVVQS